MLDESRLRARKRTISIEVCFDLDEHFYSRFRFSVLTHGYIASLAG